MAVFYLRDKMSQKWGSGAMDLVVFGATGGTGRAAVEQALKPVDAGHRLGVALLPAGPHLPSKVSRPSKDHTRV